MRKYHSKKDNYLIAASLFILATLALFVVSGNSAVNTVSGTFGMGDSPIVTRESRAPTVVSGDNIYIAWWTNNTENGNEEVMFRASSDGGATFTDKINLSNTTDAESWRVELHGEGDTVVVSWWETNQTSDIPVARISTDAGETFGPMLRLATNGTISGTEEEGGGEETGEEGAEAAEGEDGGETGEAEAAPETTTTAQNETAGEAEAAPETTTEQGDPIPDLD